MFTNRIIYLFLGTVGTMLAYCLWVLPCWGYFQPPSQMAALAGAIGSGVDLPSMGHGLSVYENRDGDAGTDVNAPIFHYLNSNYTPIDTVSLGYYKNPRLRLHDSVEDYLADVLYANLKLNRLIEELQRLRTMPMDGTALPDFDRMEFLNVDGRASGAKSMPDPRFDHERSRLVNNIQRRIERLNIDLYERAPQRSQEPVRQYTGDAVGYSESDSSNSIGRGVYDQEKQKIDPLGSNLGPNDHMQKLADEKSYLQYIFSLLGGLIGKLMDNLFETSIYIVIIVLAISGISYRKSTK